MQSKLSEEDKDNFYILDTDGRITDVSDIARMEASHISLLVIPVIMCIITD